MGSSPRCLISVLAYLAMLMLVAFSVGNALSALLQHDAGAMIMYLLLMIFGVAVIFKVMQWGIS